MEYFILIFITVFNFKIVTEPVATFSELDDCFEARELLVETVGRPIRNYQAICVLWDEEDDSIERLLTKQE